MEQDTFFISEVVSETEEKPLILNYVHEKIGDEQRMASSQRLRKTRQTLKISNVEKRLLAKYVEGEPIIWDQNHELHCNTQALVVAWERIASKMPGRNVNECKVIWKSLRDAVRYRRNKIAKTADGTDTSRDELCEYEMDYSWEFSDCMSFIMNSSSSSLAKRPRRSHPMDFENSQTSELRISSVDSSNISTSATAKAATYCNDDTSMSESNYSYTAQTKQQQDDPRTVESMVNIANNISQLVKKVTEKEGRYEKPALKFDYIWANLDQFFQKMSPQDVDELNFKFIQMAYEKVLKEKRC